MNKKIMPKELVPDDLVGVSPMCAPTEEIWEMRKKWDVVKDEILLGDFPNVPKRKTTPIIL